jgi:heat shock protein HslJ
MKSIIFLTGAIIMMTGIYGCKSRQAAQIEQSVAANNNSLFIGKTWTLAELNGFPVATPTAYLTFDADGVHVSGNLGCNTFSGVYELKENNRIRFSQLAVTAKMCLNMDSESELKKILEHADSYSVSKEELVLLRARMAPLARFVPAK